MVSRVSHDIMFAAIWEGNKYMYIVYLRAIVCLFFCCFFLMLHDKSQVFYLLGEIFYCLSDSF